MASFHFTPFLFHKNKGVSGRWRRAGALVWLAILATPLMAFAGPRFVELKTFKAPPSEMFVWGNQCYFGGAFDSDTNVELWRSNGTSAGTQQLRDIRVGPLGSYPKGFVYGPGRGFIYFSAYDQASGEEVWAVDPATGAAWLFLDLNKTAGVGTTPRYLAPLLESPLGLSGNLDFACAAVFGSTDNVALVYAPDFFIRKSDLLDPRDITPGRWFSTGMIDDAQTGRGWWTAFYCSSDSPSGNGRELVRLNWTPYVGFTVNPVDINPNAASSNPANFTSSGNEVFFTADNGTHGIELWIHEGNGGEVRLVKDIRSGSDNSSPLLLTSAGGGTIYFTAFTAANGRELWKSNGTEAGTVMIKDIIAGAANSVISDLCMAGSTLFFAATDGVNGRELWKSNGTEAGTVMVKNIRAGGNGSEPGNLVAMGGKCYFTCDSDGDGRKELWESNGTEAGTMALMTSFIGNGAPEQLTPGDSKLYFIVDNTLMMFDPAGTPPPSAPSNLALVEAKTDSLRFQWTDNSATEDGFNFYFGYGFGAPPFRASASSSSVPQNRYSFDNLNPNTPYSFSVRSYYNTPDGKVLSQWPSPAYITRWTLSPRPADIAGSFYGGAWTNYTTISFDALQTTWGEGGVNYYRYIWNTLTSHTFTGVENEWSGGSVLVPIPSSGVYYLHVQSVNEEDAPNPDTASFGPYLIDQTPPAAPPAPVGALYTAPSVIFEWDEAEDAGGSGVASYECQIGTAPGTNNVYTGGVGLNRSMTITGSSGNTYYCRVQAIDAAGNAGAWSANSAGVVYSDQSGSLSVSMSPSMAVIAGAGWRRVGTTAWLGNNAVESNVPVGTQLVEFKKLNGWLKPGNKTVTINNGEQTNTSGAYARGGTLKVTILPPESVAAGAKWRYDTGFYTSGWFDSGAVVSVAMTTINDVSYFNIEFKDLPTWIAPETIPWAAVYAGQLTEVEGDNTTYSSATGAISVVISPEEAVQAEAQWRRTSSVEWLNSGDTDTTVPVGLHQVTFKDIPNWNKPGDAWVIVSKDSTATLIGGGATYTPHTGSLTVNLEPEAVRTAGAQWRRIGGGDWRLSGETQTGIPVGEYVVEFSPVNGWVKPNDHDEIGITNGLNYILSIPYTQPTDLSAKVVNHILGRVLLDPTLLLAADANDDGKIDVADVVILIDQGK